MSREAAFEIGQLYRPLKQIADTLTAAQQDLFIRLPGLQGYWPMGIRFSSGAVVEHGGAGNSLLQTGTCPTGFDGESYIQVGNGTNYLFASGGFGITGLETFIETAFRGLTVGCWFKVDSSPSVQPGIASKDGPAPQRGYVLGLTTTDAPFFGASGTGSTSISAVGAGIALGEWHFFTGRFIPSTEVAIFSGGIKTTNTTSIPASINVSTQNFEVGRYLNDNTRIVHGKVRDLFVCSAALDDPTIEQLRVSSSPT